MKNLLALAFFFIFAFTTSCDAQKWLKGHWVGTGFQYNSDISTWDIDFEFHSKNDVIIKYPTLACSGTFAKVSSNRHRAIFREKINVGLDNCFDNSKVIITKIDDNYISIAYFLPEQFKGPMATAILGRKKLLTKTIKKM